MSAKLRTKAQALIEKQWCPEEREGVTPEIFTCWGCTRAETCRSAFDRYNIDGDCLEEK